MAIKNVTIVGANGSVGPAILKRLIDAGIFNVTVITRASSKSEYPESVRTYRVADSMPKDELVTALKGQDALVIAFAGYYSDDQIKFADAALEAGVQRIIPPDFGSCDSEDPRALAMIPLYTEKKKVREYLQQLESRGNLSWTSIVCGHFFDWSLTNGFFHLDLDKTEALILDDGEAKFSATNLDTVGLAVVRVLQKLDETKNKVLFIESFCINQNDIVSVVERVTGQSWNKKYESSDEFLNREKKKMDQGDTKAREDVVWAQGLRDTNWESKENFANTLLGLENEDLEKCVKTSIGLTDDKN